MEAGEAYRVLAEHLTVDVGRFYGPPALLSLGTGLLYAGVRYPVYDDDRSIFVTVRGFVYVLTHECDVSQENVRPFNEDVLICPIIPLGAFVERFMHRYKPESLRSFLVNIALRRVSRLMYFPPLHPDLQMGGMLYFNHLANTRVRAFELEEARAIGALSMFGLREVDIMLQNHLMRPKDEALWFSGWYH